MVDIQRQIYSGRYTAADTQRQIHSGGYQCQINSSGKQRQINSSGYTAADTAADIQHSRHSGRYTMADLYTVTDIQPDIQYQVRIHIHSGRYTEVVQDTHHDIHSGGYMAANTQQWIQTGR